MTRHTIGGRVAEAAGKCRGRATRPALRAVGAAFIVGAALVAALPGARAADAVTEFYTGKTLNIIVGYGAGGGYDQTSRILAKYMPQHIPGNPRMVVQNMPGAGTVVAANYVNNLAPKDGTVIGLYGDLMLLAPLLKIQGIQFDPRKFGWIGTLAARSCIIAYVRSDAPATTIEGIKKTEVLIGADGPDATSSYAYLLNDLFGTKFKIVQGYKGTNDIQLALERNEVSGQVSQECDPVKRAHPNWFDGKFLSILLQMTPKASSDFKDVPLAYDLAKTEEERQVMDLVLGTGQFLRSFSVAPGVPEERLAALREAFVRTIKDPAFAKEYATAFPPGIEYQSPEQIMGFMTRVYAFPASVAERAAKYVAQ